MFSLKFIINLQLMNKIYQKNQQPVKIYKPWMFKKYRTKIKCHRFSLK